MENTTQQPIEESGISVKELTSTTLAQMLEARIIQRQQHMEPDNSSVHRLAGQYIKLFNFLLVNISNLERVENKDRKLELKGLNEKTRIEIENNLLAYTFMLSRNPQFPFEWTYLLGKVEKLKMFYLDINRYFKFLISDINAIIAKLQPHTNLKFIVDRFLTITYFYDHEIFTADVDFSEAWRLTTVKGDKYQLKLVKVSVSNDDSDNGEDGQRPVKLKEYAILCATRYKCKPEDIEKNVDDFVKTIQSMLTNLKLNN